MRLGYKLPFHISFSPLGFGAAKEDMWSIGGFLSSRKHGGSRTPFYVEALRRLHKESGGHSRNQSMGRSTDFRDEGSMVG